MRKYVLVALATAALAASGCGSSSNDSSESSNGGAAANAPAGDAAATFIADAKATLAKNVEGTDRALPTEPVKAVRGKKIFAVSCTSAGPGCQLTMEAFRDAAKTLAWQVTIADGKGTPEGQSAAIDAGIAVKPDAIVLMAVDCPDVKAALERANSAKIPVYGVNAVDCDDPDSGGGQKLMDATFDYGPFGDPVKFFAEVWKMTANYVIASTDGKGKILHVSSQQPVLVKKSNATFKEEMDKCTTCTVYETAITLDDLINSKVEAKVTAALTAHPDVDAVVAPYDAAVSLGIGNAVEAARRNSGKPILLTGMEGLPANLELIKKGVQTMVPGSQPIRWWGWITMDGLLRMFAGQPQVDSGQGLQVITKDNLPSTPYYDGNPRSKGYEANYKKLWGVN
jgi:ribose transport system substrate-binding protein